MPSIRPKKLPPSEGLPLNDHVDAQLAGMRFPDVSRLPEPLLVGVVGGVVAAESFGFASGATYREHILPGLLAGVAAALGMCLLCRWPWKLARHRHLAGFVMLLILWLTAGVAGMILVPSVVYRIAFEADPRPPCNSCEATAAPA
ncbi:MAG TPA: hypothetical protein VGR35_09675 [Tepidisphaeraceae bacterium]|nr:hypothetical protein [Tepidisphaeraceae bacterium]